MDVPPVISREQFARRLADLCLSTGLTGLPRDASSRHVLLRSMVSGFPVESWLAEHEVNCALAKWIEVSQIPHLDHVSLRRFLVDAGYLTRRADGSAYARVAVPAGQPAFASDVDRLDLHAVLEARRAEIARRKAEYLAKAAAKEPSAR